MKSIAARKQRARSSSTRMTDADVQRVLHEMDFWMRGERTTLLTWKQLEEASGFSRQSLAGHCSIIRPHKGEAEIGGTKAAEHRR